MSSDDERYVRNLRGYLGTALDEITPQAPPTTAIRQRGNSIKTQRRRQAYGLSVAGMVVAAIVTAAALTGTGTTLPSIQVKTVHYKVSVGAVPAGSARGLIAQGAINGQAWQVNLTRGQHGAICVQTNGADPQGACGPVAATGNQASIEAFSDNRVSVLYGTVTAKVTKVTMALSNGQVVSMLPVSFAGRRWIAAEFPVSLRLFRAIAYGREGELATAVPFAPKSGSAPMFQNWQRRGEQVTDESTYTIGRGVVAGRRWLMTVYVGPWGQCAEAEVQGEYQHDGGCWSGTVKEGGGLSSAVHGRIGWSLGAAGASVSFLMVNSSDGQTIRVPVARIGKERLYAIVLPPGVAITSWSSYDASGHRLRSGKGAPG